MAIFLIILGLLFIIASVVLFYQKKESAAEALFAYGAGMLVGIAIVYLSELIISRI